MKRKNGFTLIELLIVIGIIGFLAAAILVAVDPVKRIQDSRDARRFSEANGMLNAILNKQVDDRARFDGVTTVGDAPIITDLGSGFSQVIVRSSAGINCSSAATRPGCNQLLDTTASKNCVANLQETVDTTEPVLSLIPNYISEAPYDPRGNGTDAFCGTGSSCATVGNLPIGITNTGYYIHRTAGNRIEIGACQGEQLTGAGAISVKR
ncbi:MAG: hypothetical protein RLZZ324_921 [Candidatus Parcubacteria bacterium]|jgi:prepilin-type N-terminal cleavage/methylation domain-containing protein